MPHPALPRQLSRDTVVRVLGPAVGLLLFSFALWILQHELRAYHYADLARELRNVPPTRLVLAALLTVANYLVLTGYDVLALRFVGQRLPYRRVGLASFVGYAASQSLGFPLLTGALLRYRFYTRWGVPALDVARVIAF